MTTHRTTTLALIKGYRQAPVAVRSKMDTIRLTPEFVKTWASPPFQRPLRENEKVRALAEELKNNNAVVPGVLTIGVIGKQWYIVDGQHRVRAFEISGLAEAYADVRICTFESLAEMGEEFVYLNSSIVRMRPDDVLRGLEGTLPALLQIRKSCDFVGYDQIRRGTASPIVSMSTVLRCWHSSEGEVPGKSDSALNIARTLSQDAAEQLVQFLSVAVAAWRRDPEYFRLWSSLNLALCMWLWRRTVLSQYSTKSIRMTAHQFSKCLMALSAQGDYLDWLLGRNMCDRDRSPCYQRIKGLFARRLAVDMPGVKVMLPQPAWSSWTDKSKVT